MKTGSKLEEVMQAMKKAKDRRMYERYQALYLHLKGIQAKEIASILNRSVKTVKGYIRSYEVGGLSALQMNYSPGAPVRLTKEQQEKLKQTIVNSVPTMSALRPATTGRWKSSRPLPEREFGLRYSLRGVSKMMHRQGLSLYQTDVYVSGGG